MGLGAVLVDRARRIRRAPTSRKVDGTTVYDSVEGPWFPARLELPAAPKSPGPGGGPRRTTPSPSLIYRPLLPSGDPVALGADDKVEVDSPQLGRHTFEVTGDPEPWRKKRSVIGFQAALRRVEEHSPQTPVP